jgi:hypothetical protein
MSGGLLMTAKTIQDCLIDRFGLPEAQRLSIGNPVVLLPCVEDKTPYEPPEHEGSTVEFSCNNRSVLVIIDDRAVREQERHTELEDGPSATKIPVRRLLDLRPASGATVSGDSVPDFGPESPDPLKDIFG